MKAWEQPEARVAELLAQHSVCHLHLHTRPWDRGGHHLWGWDGVAVSPCTDGVGAGTLFFWEPSPAPPDPHLALFAFSISQMPVNQQLAVQDVLVL